MAYTLSQELRDTAKMNKVHRIDEQFKTVCEFMRAKAQDGYMHANYSGKLEPEVIEKLRNEGIKVNSLSSPMFILNWSGEPMWDEEFDYEEKFTDL